METWTEVPGREGYLVSDQGRAAKLMTQKPGPNGYIQFAIPRPDGKRYRDYLHQWVLWAFTGPRPEGLVARHINDVPTDNRAVNLAWGTKRENRRDMTANGKRLNKTHCKWGHLLEGENVAPGNRCRTCQRARARAQRAA